MKKILSISFLALITADVNASNIKNHGILVFNSTIRQSYGLSVPGTNAAIFKLVDGGAWPSTNFNFTTLTIKYYGNYISSSNCTSFDITGSSTGGISINLPDTWGLDATSAANIYFSHTLSQPTSIHCISLQAAGTDNTSAAKTSDTKYYPVDCSSGTQCVGNSTSEDLTLN